MKFTIDDVQYDVFVEALSREAKIKDGKNSSSTLSGLYKRDVIGTSSIVNFISSPNYSR